MLVLSTIKANLVIRSRPCPGLNIDRVCVLLQGTVQQVSTIELKGTGESVNFTLDLAKLLVQCLSLGIIQGTIAGLYGQFPSPVYQIGDNGQSAVCGADKIGTRFYILDRLG